MFGFFFCLLFLFKINIGLRWFCLYLKDNDVIGIRFLVKNFIVKCVIILYFVLLCIFVIINIFWCGIVMSILFWYCVLILFKNVVFSILFVLYLLFELIK